MGIVKKNPADHGRAPTFRADDGRCRNRGGGVFRIVTILLQLGTLSALRSSVKDKLEDQASEKKSVPRVIEPRQPPFRAPVTTLDPARAPRGRVSRRFPQRRDTTPDGSRWTPRPGPRSWSSFLTSEGLRFTIPNGLGEGPAVATKFGIRGDFEITATFEVLSKLRPDVGYGMGADMVIKPPGGWDKFASISRFSKTDDTVFSMVHKEKVGEKENWNAKLHPTRATSGRLRLVRVGPTLHYQLAEGDAKIFHEMFVSEYGAEDLECVRLSATTGGSNKAVDLLWKDLSVRAEELPGWVGPDPKSRRSPPWITAVFVSATLLLGLMGMVWWLASSHRARTGPARKDVRPEKSRSNVVVWNETSLKEMETAAAAFGRERPEAATCLQRPRCRFSLRGGDLHGPFTAWRPLEPETLKTLGKTWEEIRDRLPVLYEGTYQNGKRHGTFSYHNDQGQTVTRRFRNGRLVR